MILALILPAYALTVPVRASYKEEIEPGEAAVISSATTGTVTLWNSAGTRQFTVSENELTANKREASGKDSFSFSASPGGSIRTWAIYYIDADGAALGDPEIVDVSFDSLGNGTVAARPSSSRLTSLAVKPAEKNTGGYSSATTKLTVQDSGANAAYVGVVELTNNKSGSDLATDPDMTLMSATIYATFQALGLDAIVALDSYAIQLDGTLTVDGLAVASDGKVESGADLRWDVGFYTGETTCQKSGVCTPIVGDSISYLEPIGAVKKKSVVAPRVTLKDSDIFVDSTDASYALTIQGDVRELEVSASLEVYASGVRAAARDVVTLDPGGFGVEAKRSGGDDTGVIVDTILDADTDIIPCPDYGSNNCDDNVQPPPAWTYMADNTFDVVILDGGGAVVATHYCQLVPTAATLAGTAKRDVLVGECTHDDGGTEVRRLRASIGDRGWIRWTIDLAGPAFAEERTMSSCEKGGSCTESTVSVLGGTVQLELDGVPFLARPMNVTETDFDLPFLFDLDVAGMDAVLAVDLYSEVPLTWSFDDGVVTAKDGEDVMASFYVEDVGIDKVGDCSLKGWAVGSASVPAGLSEGPVALNPVKTGPGTHVCR